MAAPLAIQAPAYFIKTEKQRLACDLMNRHEITMLEGGARSGKTAIIIRQILVRAMKTKSRHLAARYRLKDVKATLGLKTIPDVFALCFPDVPYDYNHTEQIVRFEAASGEESELWLAGVDHPDRMDKILGMEFSSVFLNEVSQIPFDAVTLMQSRLAETSGLSLRMYMDQNPLLRTHWTHRLVHEGMTPTREKVDWDIGVLLMNPVDNLANIPKEYYKILQRMPERQRKRFLEGLYQDAIEGALWTDSMLNDAKLREPGKVVETIIAIDPSVSHTEDSDECGIVVVSRDDSDGGIFHSDHSEKLHVDAWARRSVDLYHEYKANVIVAEVNNGGDLVESVIHNVDRTVPVKKVHAAKSKFARAEPIAQLYEQGRISHEGDWPDLEEELTTYVPRDARWSPNRLDALVWGFTYLLDGGQDSFGIIAL